MGWKRRAALEAKEAAIAAAEAGDDDAKDRYSGPRVLRPVPDDAVEISYEELMAMMFKEGGAEEHSAEEAKAQQLADWRASRKLVNVNALFAPR